MKIIYAILSALPLIGLTSCDDGIDETYLRETPSKLYLSTSGYVTKSIYDFGEETKSFDLYVNKSGYVDIATDVTFSYDENVVTEYQEMNPNAELTVLPASAGTFSEQTLSMAAGQTLGKTNLSLNLTEIRPLIEAAPEGTYVFPVRISTPEGGAEVNTDKDYLLMQIDLIHPIVTLKGKGTTTEIQADLFRNPEQTSVSIPIEFDLPFDNEDYDFRFTYGADPDLLADYNSTHMTNYELLPAGSYTLPDMAIDAGDSKASGNIRIDLSTLQKPQGGKSYLLPIRVADSGNEQIPMEEESVCYIKLKMVARFTGAWSNTIGAGESGVGATVGETYSCFLYSRNDALEILKDETILAALNVITDEDAIVCAGWGGTMFEQCSPIIKITDADAGNGKKKVEILAGWAREGAGWEAASTANNKSTYDPVKNEIFLDYTGQYGWGAYHIQRTYSNQVIQESYQ